jgi:hypothetical protein
MYDIEANTANAAGRWSTQTRTFDGDTLQFETYSPADSDPDILFVHHGSSRSTYGSGSEDLADEEGFAVFSPIFPSSRYDSDEYQRGGIVDDRDRVLSEDRWTTRLEEPMVEWARSQVDDDADVYLFGFSAGGQYLSRVAAYERPQGVDRIVIGSPSTWVLPSLAEDAPYGFDGLGTDAEERAALQEYLALPMTIYLGSEDDNPNDPDLATGAAAMRQGANRLERGINTFEMGQDVAEENGWDFNWTLVIADGVGHGGSSMLRAPEMTEALHPVGIPANEDPYDLVLTGSSVDETAADGTLVGELTAEDPDGDRLDFSVAGDARFEVRGSDLVVARGADLTVDADRTVSLTVSASDGHGGMARANVDVTINNVSDEGPIGQAGTVTFGQASGRQWHSVMYAEALNDPAVVMGGLISDGWQASTLRVRNVTDTGFQFQLDEWDYLDGSHVTETASWVAIEKGTHEFSNGMVIEAGSAAVSGSATRVALGSGNFDSTPAVLAQVTSTNDADAVTDRIQSVSASGFGVRLDNEERQFSGSHGSESVDWIAVEKGGSASSGAVAGRTGDLVTHTPYRIDFPGAFSADDFAFVADMQTRGGSDIANLRVSESDNTSASVYVHEEQSRDQEIVHTSEVVAYLGLDHGLIYA